MTWLDLQQAAWTLLADIQSGSLWQAVVVGERPLSLSGDTRRRLSPSRRNETTDLQCEEYTVHHPGPRLGLEADMVPGESFGRHSLGRDQSRMLFRTSRDRNGLSGKAWLLSAAGHQARRAVSVDSADSSYSHSC